MELNKQNIKAFVAVSAVGLVLVFALQNAKLVEVSFLFWSFQMSRIALILIVFAFGCLAGYFGAGHLRRKKEKQKKKIK